MDNTINIIKKIVQDGVLHRDEVKNDMEVIAKLKQRGLLRRIHRGKKVFYELTEKALPILELRRRAILEEARLLAQLHKPPSIYHALLDDVRFLDENHPDANYFKFLGDWQLNRPTVPAQLELAKLRYYEKHTKRG